MDIHKYKFGIMLKEAVRSISFIEDKTQRIIKHEIACETGYTSGAIEYWIGRGTSFRPDKQTIEKIAWIILDRSEFGRDFIEEFVEAADFNVDDFPELSNRLRNVKKKPYEGGYITRVRLGIYVNLENL